MFFSVSFSIQKVYFKIMSFILCTANTTIDTPSRRSERRWRFWYRFVWRRWRQRSQGIKIIFVHDIIGEVYIKYLYSYRYIKLQLIHKIIQLLSMSELIFKKNLNNSIFKFKLTLLLILRRKELLSSYRPFDKTPAKRINLWANFGTFWSR